MIIKIDRNALMLKMREANITDAAIGRTFDISRERVRQILGNGGTYGKWNEDKVDNAKKMFEDGNDLISIGKAIEISDSQVRERLLSLYSRSEWVKIKHLRKKRFSQIACEQRHNEIKSRIMAFKSTLNGNGAKPTDLMRYNRSLYCVANMMQPWDKWCEECGIENKRVGRHASR